MTGAATCTDSTAAGSLTPITGYYGVAGSITVCPTGSAACSSVKFIIFQRLDLKLPS